MFVNDILDSCEKIRIYTAGMGANGFLADRCVYDASLRNLEIIGEAAKHLPTEVRAQIPGIEWTKIAGMRDWLAHAYFGLDDEIIWNVIETRLPELERAVRAFNDTDESESS